jgi:hypothetical protein
MGRISAAVTSPSPRKGHHGRQTLSGHTGKNRKYDVGQRGSEKESTLFDTCSAGQRLATSSENATGRSHVRGLFAGMFKVGYSFPDMRLNERGLLSR